MHPLPFTSFLLPSSYTQRKTLELCEFLRDGRIIKLEEEENCQSEWAINPTLFRWVWRLCGKVWAMWLASFLSKVAGVWCKCNPSIHLGIQWKDYKNWGYNNWNHRGFHSCCHWAPTEWWAMVQEQTCQSHRLQHLPRGCTSKPILVQGNPENVGSTGVPGLVDGCSKFCDMWRKVWDHPALSYVVFASLSW